MLGLGVIAFVAIRWRLHGDAVANPDIAGILYNADLILDGGLPYRDTAEIKPPGAFGIVAIAIALFGRGLGALQTVYSGWLLLGALAIWVAAVAEGGAKRRIAAAIAVAVYLFYIGMFTYNYSGWMVPLYACSFAAIVRGLDRGGIVWPLLGGAFATLATLTIQRAGVLGPLAVLLWVLACRRGAAGGRPKTLLLWIIGATVAALPLLAVYTAAGHGGDLVAAVLPFGTANEYAGAAEGRSPWKLIGAVAEQFSAVFRLGGVVILCATAAHVGLARKRVEVQRPVRGWLFLAASVVGVGLGGARYYIHYLPQYVPAVALLCGDVALVTFLGGAFGASRRTSWLPRALLAVLAVVTIKAGADIRRGRAERYEGRPARVGKGRTAPQVVGTIIAQRTSPEDRIFVWGWSAWPTYYWADRRAPGRVYKPLGTLTTFNQNTSFALGEGAKLRRGPVLEAFLDEFNANPPVYVVVSNSFTASFGSSHDPLLEFTDFEQQLQREYRVEQRVGDVVLLRRRGK